MADTVLVSESFDGVTAPATPSSLTYSGSWQTSTAQKYSGANSLVATTTSYSQAYLNALDGNGGNAWTEAKLFAPSPLSSSAVSRLEVCTRSDSATTSSNRYSGILRLTTTTGSTGGGVQILKTTGGSGTSLTGNPQLAASFAAGVWYRVRLTTVGTGLYLTVQRMTDGLYLCSDGNWAPGAGYCLAATDSALTAAGYCGLVVSGGSTVGYCVDDVAASTTAAVPLPALDAPASVTATAGNGKVALSWVNAAGAVASLIKRSLHGQNNFLQVAIVTGATAAWTDYGVTNGVTYDYQIYNLD